MDVAYNQHAARRKNRSTTNLNHLSLAPLTTKLPLDDHDSFVDAFSTPPPPHTTSYLQGKSAPTTPGLLTRSPVRSRSRDRKSRSSASLPKSRSATHLSSSHHHHSSSSSSHRHHRRSGTHGTTSPTTRKRRGAADDPGTLHARDRNDSDWLLRAGALISSETRESKGQAWLATRESSTSLAGMRGGDADDEAFERELAREKELASRGGSRRGSLVPNEDGVSSASGGSRSHSRSQMMTPMERRSWEGYFAGLPEDDGIPGPDFVNLDEKLEAIEQDSAVDDEDQLRRLVKRERAGFGSWFGSVIGWPLFAVQENDDEGSDEADGESTEGELEEEEEMQTRRRSTIRQFEGVSNVPEDNIPAPKAGEGGWQDAAWLLSVASKVIL